MKLTVSRPLLPTAVVIVLAATACASTRPADREAPAKVARTGETTGPDAPNVAEEDDGDVPDPHRVVFADRIGYAYLLVLPPSGRPPSIGRDDIVAIADAAFEEWKTMPEVAELLEMVRTDPASTRIGPTHVGETDEDLARTAALRTKAVLGLHVEVLPLHAPGEPPLVPAEQLRDPLLARDLPEPMRNRYAAASHALLLRAEYRNVHRVRGLRLLQTLVDHVSRHYDAVIFDFDTKETVRPETFQSRMFRQDLFNVADQLAVVPLPGLPSDPPGTVRLSTRGMRRFGAPDLELAGLPRDPAVLQAGTHLVNGLARILAEAAEIDPSGFAREADDEIEIHYRDVDAAYAGRSAHLAHCEGCPERVRVHLVRRPEVDTDPRGHPVVRIVAPRSISGAPDYDHAAWVRTALRDLLGA
ncbi:MAG: hypothetical protein D6705_17915 [Deltaproteobacteria bacterium]|nr:MAG: hypothetical protein D6705_17915 [Deltaproteobacteria bacterium]